MKKTALLRFSLLAACAALALQSSFGVVTPPVGAISQTLKGGGKFNLISRPFVNSAEFQGQVVSVSGTGVEISDASGLSGLLYLEVGSGTLDGAMTNIVSISSNTLTTGDDLSADLAIGDTIIVRKLETIDSYFGVDNSFGLKSSPTGDLAVDQPDILYILDPETQQTTRHFYSSYTGFEGWYNAVSFSPSGDTVLYPESGVAVFVEGADVDIVHFGTVKQGEFDVAVYTGFNLMSVLNPISDVSTVESRSLTLGNSGLFTGDSSTGVTPSPDGDPSVADQIYVLNPDTQVTKRYFYVTLSGYEGWYDVVSFAPADSVRLDAASAFYLKRSSGGPFNWSQPLNHSN
jgi:hypothetical protein